MVDLLQAIAVVAVLGLIYVAVLAVTVRLFRSSPQPEEWPEKQEADQADEATEMAVLTPPPDIYIKTSADVFHYVRDRIGAQAVEYLILLLVDADHRLKVELECTDGQGGYVRFPGVELIAARSAANAAEIIYIAHNHPHGTIYPSMEDFYHTAGLYRGLRQAGIRLQDHIIVANNRYYSMKDHDAWDVVFRMGGND